MRIGLIDVDNYNKVAKFPNLALMKLSAYHKSIGDHVEWYDTMSCIDPYDIVYKAKVFDFSIEQEFIIYADKVIEGGVGYDLENKLPDHIEHVMPDYSIYNFDAAYGFLSRGCPRNCSFCNVTEHQGKRSLKVADLTEFWTDQKEIVLLDPNTFACNDWESISDQLINSGALIDFSQGVDVRVMTKEKALSLNQMNIKRIHFAWDNFDISTYHKLKIAADWLDYNRSQITVYVLVNFNTTISEDLFRIYSIRNLGFQPYVMVYDKAKLKRGNIYAKIQRWVNSPSIFRMTKRFEDYRHVASYKKESVDQVNNDENQLSLF